MLRHVVKVSTRNTRRISSAAASTQAQLLANPELTREDAETEYRWIKEEVQARLQVRATRMISASNHRGTFPRLGDVSVMKTMEERMVADCVRRRAQGEPLQYVLGDVDFGPLRIMCRAPTLIPRPETAYITSMFCDRLRSEGGTKPIKGFDLCSGTGCISLLMSHELGSRLSGTLGLDISEAAVSLARQNAAVLGVQNAKFAQLDLFNDTTIQDILQQSGGRVEFVTANPPYIPLHEWQRLPLSVKLYEDQRALLGDQDETGDGKGLTFYRQIVRMLPHILLSAKEMRARDKGDAPQVMLEIGSDQARDVVDIVASIHPRRTEIWLDQYGKDRAVAVWF